VNTAVISKSSYFGKSSGYGLSRSKIAGVKRSLEVIAAICRIAGNAFQLMRSTRDCPGNASADLNRRDRRATRIIGPLEIGAFHATCCR
jgi:hypothetical protein